MKPSQALEIILSMNVAAFKAGAKVAGSTVKQMGGTVKRSLEGTRTAFRSGLQGVEAYKNKLRELNTTAGDLKSTLGQVISLVGGGLLLGAAGRSAVNFNSTVEQSQIGLAALVRTFNQLPNSTDTYTDSMRVASEIQRQLQIEGLKTVATYEQLLVALQEGIGPAFKQGFDPGQVVQFISMMTQAAAALSLPMDQLGQEIRSILDGTIDRNSRVAKALGITNEKVKEMAASGQLFDYLKGKLNEFAVAGEDAAKTWTGSFSNLMDAVQMGLGKGLESSFSATKQLFLDLRDTIVTIDEEAGTFSFNEKITAALAKADSALSEFIAGITKDDMQRYLEILAETIAAVVDALVLFLGTMKGLLDIMGPALPTIAKWTTAFILFGGAFKVLIGLPIVLVKQVLALNVALTTMTGMSIVGWLRGLGQAAMVARAGVVALGSTFGGLVYTLLALPAAAAFAAVSVGKLIIRYRELKKIEAEIAAQEKENAAAQGELATEFQKLSDKIGVTIRSREDLKQAIKDGKVHYDDAVGEWVAGAKTMADATQKAAETQKRVTGEALEAMQKKYQEYAGKVKQLQDQIAGRERSLAEQLRAMSRTGMSDLGAWEDRKKEAEDYEAAAIKAMAAGNYEEAVRLADQAKAAYSDLNKEVKNGETVVVSQQQGLKTAMQGVEEAGNLAVEALKAQQSAAIDAMNALTEESGFQDLMDGMDESKKTWLNNWMDMRQATINELDKVESRIVAVTKDRNMTVYINEVVKKALGGPIGAVKMAAGGFLNMLSGGNLPGFGGGDRRHVLAEDGEVMLNKFSVRQAGLKAALAFNSGNWRLLMNELSKRFGQRLQFGGMVGRLPLPIMPPIPMATGGAVDGGVGEQSITMNFYDHVSGERATAYAPTQMDVNAIERMFARKRRLSSR